MSNHSTNQLLKSLEALYLKGSYEEAKEKLLSHRDQLDEGHFHYNLGTLYAKTGNDAVGRFHLEKALHEGFVNPQAFNNLKVLQTRLNVNDLGSSSRISDQALDKALSMPSSIYLSLSLILVLMVLVLKKINVLEKASSIFISLILASTPLAFSSLYLERMNYAIALEDTELFEGPSKIYDKKSIIPAGSKFIIGEINDEGWFFVKKPLELSGWVTKKNLGIY